MFVYLYRDSAADVHVLNSDVCVFLYRDSAADVHVLNSDVCVFVQRFSHRRTCFKFWCFCICTEIQQQTVPTEVFGALAEEDEG